MIEADYTVYQLFPHTHIKNLCCKNIKNRHEYFPGRNQMDLTHYYVVISMHASLKMQQCQIKIRKLVHMYPRSNTWQ